MSHIMDVKTPLYYTDGNNIKVNVITPSVRVCAFNVGNFSNGQSGTPAGTDERYNQFMDTFRQCNGDIYMFSEWDVNWNESETSESVFGFLKPYHSHYCKDTSADGGYTGQMNYSSFKITGEYYEDFNVVSRYYFIDNTIPINGKDVHFICTHLTWTSRDDAISQIQQILNYITRNNITSYVIAGDMNHGGHANDSLPQTLETKISIAIEEITLFESLGGKSVQGGGWANKDYDFLIQTAGKLGVRPPVDLMQDKPGYFCPYDNMIVSPDIKIKNADVITSQASDHDVLVVDLEI